MSSNFNFLPAKPTFGNYQYNRYCCDYISNKRLKTVYCINNENFNSCYTNQHANISIRNKYGINNSSSLIDYNKVFLYNNKNFKVLNRSNLNVNLYTNLNLKDVNVVQQNYPLKTPSNINENINFNENYTIDASGVLFGNTPCGIQNYVKFQEININ
jgi:hypothetical protein